VRDAERTLLPEARAFLQLLQRETGLETDGRLQHIREQIRRTGTYEHTPTELEHGARVAWRNSVRCVGRLHWDMLQIQDCRHLDRPEDAFEAILEHLCISTNGGKIRPLITVFPPETHDRPGPRIWNPQLVRYAGYRGPDGAIVGDPVNVDLTAKVRELGWEGAGGPFDVLPIVLQWPGLPPRLFELPPDVVREVPLSHPDYPWFEELELRWHALPAISNMRLEVGGISYTAAPFSGWYMVTEIGARNLGDVARYNLLPVIAERMGLDTSTNRSLWKDRAMVELNVAVLHSYAAHGVAMVDHHTACTQFGHLEQREACAGRILPAEWSWIVPPISGSATHVFHHGDYPNVTLKPNFFYQDDPWR
jgi:nitric-oxide synthase